MRFNLSEASPPDKSIETWIKKNKKRFQDRYGNEEGLEVLYGRAWNMYNAKQDKNESLSEETIRFQFPTPAKAKLFVNTAKDLGLVAKDQVSGSKVTITSTAGAGDIIKSLGDDADGTLLENWDYIHRSVVERKSYRIGSVEVTPLQAAAMTVFAEELSPIMRDRFISQVNTNKSLNILVDRSMEWYYHNYALEK